MRAKQESKVVRDQVDRVYKKEKQLLEQLPKLIYSSNRIPARLIEVSHKWDLIIRIELTGQLKKEALYLIQSFGWCIISVTARRSRVIVFIQEC
jgi:hypothetical protein